MITLNGKQINITLFPDNTSQVWKLEEIPRICNIDWKFTHEGELMQLVQLVHLLRKERVEYISLNMDYLPYARQDKPVENDTCFALTCFAQVINSLRLDKVTCVDAHSDAPLFLFTNFKNNFPYTNIAAAFREIRPDTIAFPDRGALSRYGKEVSFLGKPYAWAEKQRDQLTGHITGMKFEGDVRGDKVLIVDDICDGGMTFVLMAKALLTAGAKSVNLYTSHGLYSKGLRPLKEAKIERIFTKDGEVSEVQGQITIKPYEE